MSKSSAYEIIFEDDQLIAVNKTPQILSIPDRHRAEIANIYT
jgi:23S rRNA-/tRNA-specific pseudouridylate synthase